MTAFLVRPDGKKVRLPDTEVEKALRMGYAMREPGKDELAVLEARQHPVIAGAEGLARGLTFGLSDPLERALGVDAQGMELRQKENPNAALLGDVVGSTASGIATAGLGEAALAARGMRGLAVASMLGEGAGISRAAAAATKIGAGAAAWGVEGGLRGLGTAISESAIKDQPLTAEKALMSTGLGALTGAGFGSLFAGAGVAADAAVSKLGATELGKTLKGWGDDLWKQRLGVGADADVEGLRSFEREAGVNPFNLTAEGAAKIGKTLEEAQNVISSQFKRLDELHPISGAVDDATAQEGVLRRKQLLDNALADVGKKYDLGGQAYTDAAGNTLYRKPDPNFATGVRKMQDLYESWASDPNLTWQKLSDNLNNIRADLRQLDERTLEAKNTKRILTDFKIAVEDQAFKTAQEKALGGRFIYPEAVADRPLVHPGEEARPMVPQDRPDIEDRPNITWDPPVRADPDYMQSAGMGPRPRDIAMGPLGDAGFETDQNISNILGSRLFVQATKSGEHKEAIDSLRKLPRGTLQLLAEHGLKIRVGPGPQAADVLRLAGEHVHPTGSWGTYWPTRRTVGVAADHVWGGKPAEGLMHEIGHAVDNLLAHGEAYSQLGASVHPDFDKAWSEWAQSKGVVPKHILTPKEAADSEAAALMHYPTHSYYLGRNNAGIHAGKDHGLSETYAQAFALLHTEGPEAVDKFFTPEIRKAVEKSLLPISGGEAPMVGPLKREAYQPMVGPMNAEPMIGPLAGEPMVGPMNMERVPGPAQLAQGPNAGYTMDEMAAALKKRRAGEHYEDLYTRAVERGQTREAAQNTQAIHRVAMAAAGLHLGGIPGAAVGYAAKRAGEKYGGMFAARALDALSGNSELLQGMSDNVLSRIRTAAGVLGPAITTHMEQAAASGPEALMAAHHAMASAPGGDQYLATLGMAHETPDDMQAANARLGVLHAITTNAKVTDAAVTQAANNLLGIKSPGRPPANKGVGGTFTKEQFQETKKNLEQLVRDPSKVFEAVPPNMLGAAPNTSGLQVQRFLQNAQYLLAHAPKDPGEGLPAAIKPKWEPSAAELAQWKQRYDAMFQPLKVLAQVGTGRVTALQVEALKFGFPSVIADMQSRVFEQMGTLKGPLGYSQKLSLVGFFGPGMIGMTPQQVMVIQMSQSAARQAGPAGPQGGMKPPDGRQKVDAKENQETQAQRMEAR